MCQVAFEWFVCTYILHIVATVVPCKYEHGQSVLLRKSVDVYYKRKCVLHCQTFKCLVGDEQLSEKPKNRTCQGI